MALDEVLLGGAVERGRCSVRLYRWQSPTLSLGYFQRFPQVSPRMLHDLPVVRRLSGGGAIVHDQELTYSCALPSDHPLARTPRSAYEAVHDSIIAVLAEFGVEACRRGISGPGRDEQFLCFQRGDCNDVLVSGSKILGSAQRRRKGAVLQHGSLILRRSSFTPEVPGLLDLAGFTQEPETLAERLAKRLGLALARNPREDELEPEEVEQARRWARERYEGLLV
jgi:lipoate-protein ligase A